ncbi:protease, partial [Streptomyces rubrisoli]|nr:protease [Streptantibioticus rubrisoli]
MDEGKAARPHWWSRPQEAPRDQDATAPSAPEAPAPVPQTDQPAAAEPDATPDARPDATPDGAERVSLSKDTPAPPAVPPAPSVPPSEPVPENPYATPLAGVGHPVPGAGPQPPPHPP